MRAWIKQGVWPFFKGMHEKLKLAIHEGAAVIEELCSSLEQCCRNFYERLSREEQLVKIAERVIPSEAWFGFAASALSQHARKGHKQGGLLLDDEV